MSAQPLSTEQTAPARPRPAGTAGAPLRARRTPSGAIGPAGPRARLRLVPPSTRAPRAPFVAVLLALLLVGLVGLLLLNTASAQDAFRLSTLQTSQDALALQRQELAKEAATLSDPAQLEARALQLGMVPVGPPTFLAPGRPFPKGAVLLGNGMVVVLAPVHAPTASIEAAPPSPGAGSAPSAAPSAKASAKVSATPSASATPRASVTASAKASARASARASTRASTRATTKASTAPSAKASPAAPSSVAAPSASKRP